MITPDAINLPRADDGQKTDEVGPDIIEDYEGG